MHEAHSSTICAFWALLTADDTKATPYHGDARWAAGVARTNRKVLQLTLLFGDAASPVQMGQDRG